MASAVFFLAWTAGFAVLFALILAGVRKIVVALGLLRDNVDKRRIPTALGVAFAPFAWPLTAASMAFASKDGLLPTAAFSAALTGFAIIGLMDDLSPEREAGGFRGHLRLLIQEKRFTTGLGKAVFGGVLALVLANLLDSGNLALVLLDGAVIALCANFFNLLDVHPGRCVKGFLLACGAVLGISLLGRTVWDFADLSADAARLYGPLWAAALVYAPVDFARKGMLGDAGSNALGAALGLLAVWELSIEARAAALVLLAAANALSEKISFTRIIRSVPPLRRLDDAFLAPPQR